jgi:hypothetical protein
LNLVYDFFAIDFLVDPNHEAIFYILGHSNFDVIIFSSNFVIHPNFMIIFKIFNVGERIDFEFLTRELVSKSCFFTIDGKKNRII